MKKFLSYGVLAASLVTVAQGAISQVATRAGLGVSQTIDWSQLGPAFTSVATPVVVTTSGAMGVSVDAAGGSIEVRQQSFGGWGGNFNPGEYLAWSIGNGPLTLDPRELIQCAGFNIQADFFGAFSAEIEAYDSSNFSLGVVSINGNSTSSGDGSAVFLGFASSSADVDKFVIRGVTATFSPQDFAINKVSISPKCDPGTHVPDATSSTMALALAAGAFGSMALRRRS